LDWSVLKCNRSHCITRDFHFSSNLDAILEVRNQEREVNREIDVIHAQIANLKRLFKEEKVGGSLGEIMSSFGGIKSPTSKTDPFEKKIELKIQELTKCIDGIRLKHKDLRDKCNLFEDECQGYLGFIEQVEFLHQIKAMSK
jgi:hypothetical protein